MAVFLLAVGFAVILAGAVLFTNAVEWLGFRAELGTGAVGSVLAAVATALPESAIAVIAIIRGTNKSDEVAVGAIIGAPFMLATIAMAIVGTSAIVFRRRRPQGRSLKAHRPTVGRDLAFFLLFFGAALLLGAGAPAGVRYASAVLFVLAYAVYVVLTLRQGGEVQAEEDLAPLTIDPTPRNPPPNLLIAGQFLLALGAVIGGAHLFVEQLLEVATHLPVSPLVLALLLAPLATELPEKANSFFWVREGKDALALGNITGAMVFQSTLPVAAGLAFTSWEYDRYAALAAGLALVGGAVAVWSLRFRARFSVPAILIWATLFVTFAVAAIVMSA